MGDRKERVILTQHFASGAVTTTEWKPQNATPENIMRALNAGPPKLEPGEWTGQRIKLGPVRVFYGKNVGPPPWPFPRLRLGWRNGPTVGVGWRMTAYQLAFHWEPHRA